MALPGSAALPAEDNAADQIKLHAEDTDAVIDGDAPIANATDEKRQAVSSSMRLRCLGGLVLVVAVGLIIYGLVSSAGAAPDEKKRRRNQVKVRELTIKPKDEARTFEAATLPNGLQVVTVRDRRALKKGFAAAVQAGSFDDPGELLGLAHFTEHMLFLGTDKYSDDPSGFDNFIAAHGGWNNAYTAEEVTVYFAAVAQDAAAEGFDRFADFFRAPLFSDAYVGTEVHNIDSEHTKNIHNPTRQVLQVLYSLADERSPLSRFHTGNLQTLQVGPKSKETLVDKLKKFWGSHYCPSRMKVVTVGSESNAEQLQSIRKKFGELESKSKSCKRPRPSHRLPQPWSAGHLGKWVNVQGMLPRSFLWLMFPLPDMTDKYASEPLEYIGYMLNYDGVDSLSRVLKDTLGISASFQAFFDTTSAGTILFMAVQLTTWGRLYKELVLDVIFSYLAVMRRDGVRKDLYDSLASVKKLKWDWGGQGGPLNTASELAERMTRVKPEDLLWADSVIKAPDPQLVNSLLLKLVPTNMNVAYVKEQKDTASDQLPNASGFFHNQTVKTLPYFGIEYSEQETIDLMPDAVAKWTQWLDGEVTATSIENHIRDFITAHGVHVIPKSERHSGVPVPKSPARIQGIPHALTFEHMHAAFAPYSSGQVVDTLLYGPTPAHLELPRSSDSPYGTDPEVWYRGGWMVASPKVKVSLSFRPLRAPDEPELLAVRDLELELYGRLLGDEMSPIMTDITATGMSYEIKVGGSGLEFRFVGFRPSMHRLINGVLSQFNTFNADPRLTPKMRWKKTKHALREDLITYADLPLNYAISDRNLLLTKGSHSRKELLEALDTGDITRESASTSVSKLLLSRQLRLTALAMGNVDEEDSRLMIGHFLRNVDYPKKVTLAADSGAEVERLSPIVRLNRPVEVRKQNPKEGDTDDVVAVSLVYGVSTVESRVNLGLLSQLLRPLAYNELRTKQHLGYLVSASVVQLSNVQLMSCVVQGGNKSADAMEAAIHYVFTDLMPKRIKKLTDEEFQAYKSSFRQDLVQPPLTMKDEFDHFAGPVDQNGIGFALQHEMLRYLDGPNVTKESLLKVWVDFAIPKDGVRGLITVKYFGNDKYPDGVPAHPTLEEANKTWVDQKVPSDARLLLAREHEKMLRLEKADSQERAALAMANGWFATTQNCDLQDETTASKEPPKVPQQVKDLIEKRKEDIDTFESTPVVYTTTNITSSSLAMGRREMKRRFRLSPLARTHTLVPRAY